MPTFADRSAASEPILAVAVAALLVLLTPGPAPAQDPGAEEPPTAPTEAETPAEGSGAASPAIPQETPADTGDAPALPPLPKTAAGAALGEWLEAFNSSDEGRLTKFIAGRFAPTFLERLPVDALVAFHMQTVAETGELAVAEMLESGDERLRLHARGANGPVLDITLEVEPEPPHRIAGLRVVPAEAAQERAEEEKPPPAAP